MTEDDEFWIAGGIVGVMLCIAALVFMTFDKRMEKSEQADWEAYAKLHNCKPGDKRYGARWVTWTCENGDKYLRSK